MVGGILYYACSRQKNIYKNNNNFPNKPHGGKITRLNFVTGTAMWQFGDALGHVVSHYASPVIVTNFMFSFFRFINL